MEVYVLIIWLIIAAVLFVIKNDKNRYKSKQEKTKVVLIITMIYYVVCFLLGLKTGYSNTPYSSKFLEIIKNLVFIVGIKLLQEYVRCKGLEKFRNIYWYILLTVIFAILQLEFSKIIGVTQKGEVLQYVLSSVLPIFTESTLLTYLSINGGYALNLSYSLPNSLVTIFSPIFPELDWFLASVLIYVRAILTFLFVNYEDTLKIKLPKRTLKKENPIKNALAIIVVIIVVCFVTGILPYRPVAIISNSMYPVFARGDICIVKNIAPDDTDIIQVGDVIQYNLNNINVIHRVIEVNEELTKITYITKGDSNSMQDTLPVEQEQVKGVVVKVIKYLGFPSVWFSENFLLK